MRKGIKNDKVIKAMTLGLAAMMALSNPVMVLADTTDDAGNDNATTENIDNGVADAAQDAYSDASDAVSDASSSSSDAVSDAVNQTVGDEQYGVNVTAITDAANATDEEDNKIPNMIKIDDSIDTNLIVAENMADAADTLVDVTGDKVDEAATAAEKAKAEVEEAINTAAVLTDAINNAKTIPEAQAAYDALVALEKQTADSLEEKRAIYDNVKAAYDQALKDIAAYEDAYRIAVDTAAISAEKAASDLLNAQAALAILEGALTDAQKAVANYSNAALEIVKMQAALANYAETNNKVDWRGEDKLFEAIVKTYYVPETIDENATNITVTRVKGIDDGDYNYFKVTYYINGVKYTEYLNYKMDNGSKSEFLIFEKRDNEVDADTALKKNKDSLLYTDGVEVDSYTNADGTKMDGTYDQAAFDADVESGDVVSFDGEEIGEYEDGTVAYKKGETEETGALDDVKPVDYNEETGITTETEIGEKTTEYVVDEAGNVHEQIKQDVTTYTYSDKSFTSDEGKVYDSEDDAQDAAKEKAKELMADGDKNLDINVTGTTEYQVDTTYVETFAEHINLEESTTKWFADKGEEKAEAENLASMGVDQYVEGNVIVDKNGNKKYIIEVKNENVNTETDKILIGDGGFFGWLNFVDEYTTTYEVDITFAKVDTVDVADAPVSEKDLFAKYGQMKVWNNNHNTNNGNQKDRQKEYNRVLNDLIAKETENLQKSIDESKYLYVGDVRYENGKFVVDAVEKKVFEGTPVADKTEAESQFAAAMEKEGKDVFVISTNETEIGKYVFEGTYLEYNGSTTDAVLVEDTEYKKLKGEVEQNKNFFDGIIKLDENEDQGFIKFLDDAVNEKAALEEKYDELIRETQKAEADVADAQDRVDELNDEINKLKERGDGKIDELNDLQAELDEAEKNLKDAKDKLDELEEDKDEAEKDLRIKIHILSPEPDPFNPAEPVGPGPSVPSTPSIPTTPEIIADVDAEIPTVDAVVADADGVVTPGVAGVRVADTSEDGDGIEEESGTVKASEEIKEDEEEIKTVAKTDDASSKKGAITTIEDEEVALAATPDMKNMNWWWLLIVALLGATGYAMYKEHEKKMQEKAALADEIKKEN